MADSYDYLRRMEILAGFAEVVKLNGGCLIGRPETLKALFSIAQGYPPVADYPGYHDQKTPSTLKELRRPFPPTRTSHWNHDESFADESRRLIRKYKVEFNVRYACD